jgi:hypothetical protein
MIHQSAIPVINTEIRKHVDNDEFQINFTWSHVGVILGLGGGVLSGLAGLILTAVAFLVGNEIASASLNVAATALIFITLPAMTFGAHCLDKIETITKAKRIERCEKYRMIYKKDSQLDGK